MFRRTVHRQDSMVLFFFFALFSPTTLSRFTCLPPIYCWAVERRNTKRRTAVAKHKNTRKEGMTLLQFVFPGVLLVCAGAERRLLLRCLPFFFFVEKNSSNSWLKVLGKAVRIYEFFFFLPNIHKCKCDSWSYWSCWHSVSNSQTQCLFFFFILAMAYECVGVAQTRGKNVFSLSVLVLLPFFTYTH